MNIAEVAEKMNGVNYMEEEDRIPNNIPPYFVVVFGASDDLVSFYGGIYEQLGACSGRVFKVDSSGLLINRCIADCPYYIKETKKSKHEVKAEWSPRNKEGVCFASWEITGTMPFAPFDVMEDGELYCRGMVFDLRTCK